MKTGQRVLLKNYVWSGNIVKAEGTEGIFADRFLVKIDEHDLANTVTATKQLHDKQGGIYIMRKDLVRL